MFFVGCSDEESITPQSEQTTSVDDFSGDYNGMILVEALHDGERRTFSEKKYSVIKKGNSYYLNTYEASCSDMSFDDNKKIKITNCENAGFIFNGSFEVVGEKLSVNFTREDKFGTGTKYRSSGTLQKQ